MRSSGCMMVLERRRPDAGLSAGFEHVNTFNETRKESLHITTLV